MVCKGCGLGEWYRRRLACAPVGAPGLNQADYLAEGTGGHVAFGRNARFADSDLGNAVLSRWPIVRHDNHDVSHAGAEARGLLHCVIDRPGTELHVVCVHLGLTQSHRHDQVERLCQLLAHQVPAAAPLIVGGDYNDWRLRADRLLGAHGLHEVHRHAHGRHARSFPARWPLFMLDRIYVRGMRAHRPLPLPRRPWAQLSDHLPLAAEVAL